MDRLTRSRIVKEEAQRLGFDFAGIAKAEFMEPEARRLEEWLNRGYHGRMSYMENHFDKRVDPTKLVPGAKSVVSLVYNYFPGKKQNPKAPKLARYAYGEDYHFVIKRKLKTLLGILQEKIGEVGGRVFVDSAPVLERDWAFRSGNGWIGKNTLLIHPRRGSFFFLAEMILDIDLEEDQPLKDYCGTCRACIDACPTQAIAENGYVMDGSKCISYLTIELKEEIPDQFKGKMENWMFGCDICQEVCPWNRFSKAHREDHFEPKESIMEMDQKEWEEITEEVFQKLFKNSAVKRTKFKGLTRNLDFLKKD